ncbi:MAG TPA: heavy metal translocating P-type ATPase [Verrucomicrobiae bacterium]|jgi:Cd2+/Zn2+-exporting ATPase
MKEEAPECLLKVVGEAMKVEPSLEAVKVDHDRQAISIATLGRPRVHEIEETLSEKIAALQEEKNGNCGLLRGEGSCGTCHPPDGLDTVKFLNVRKEGNTTTIARVSCPTSPTFWQWHKIAWPTFTTRRVHFPEDEHEHESRNELIAAGMCAVFGLIGYSLNAPWSVAAYIIAYIAGGYFPAREVRESLQNRVLDVHFLMLAVALGGASIGAWGEGTMLLFLFSLSGALEHYAMGRTHKEISALFKIAPKNALVVDSNGLEQVVPVESLKAGDRLLVKPGDVFPVDGEIAKGKTAADESNLTGEAVPVEKTQGDLALAGTINLWGAVEVIATRPPSQSSLQKIIQLIQEAQRLKAPAQKFTDKFGTGYTYVVLGLAATMFFVWWLVLGRAPFTTVGSTKSAFYMAMTLMVVASPCALVLSIPSAILAAIAWAARRGILFRGGAAVEKLAQVTTVAMDKTGTLTTGELQVAEIKTYPPGREKELAELAYGIERLSAHPLARAITRHAKHEGICAAEVDRFESVTGQGLRGIRNSQPVLLGRRSFVATSFPAANHAEAASPQPGYSEVWIGCGDLVGRIILKDEIRPQARDVIVAMRKLGLKMVALTGDRRETGEALKQTLALDDVRAELKPEDKVDAISRLSESGEKVAMIGDGVNDAPSLAAAYVGVAMGSRGSDAALEQAEVVLMHDRLENFLAAYHLSRRARRIIYQNLVISLGTVVTLVAFALAGAIPLTLGVLGHEGSTVIVVTNSLRLLFSKKTA